jgi:hypothetical protein
MATDHEELKLRYWAVPPSARRLWVRIAFLGGILGVLSVWWVWERWRTLRHQNSIESLARLNAAYTRAAPSTSAVKQSFARADIVASLASGAVARATFAGKDLDQITQLFPGVGTGMEDRIFATAARNPTEIKLTRTDGSSVFVVVTTELGGTVPEHNSRPSTLLQVRSS